MSGLIMLSCVDTEVTDAASLEDAAALFDYLRDYLDVKAEISHQDRLGVAADLELILARLRDADGSPSSPCAKPSSRTITGPTKALGP